MEGVEGSEGGMGGVNESGSSGDAMEEDGVEEQEEGAGTGVVFEVHEECDTRFGEMCWWRREGRMVAVERGVRWGTYWS